MVEIKFSEKPEKHMLGLTLHGHSGFADFGEDIVCSAVSILLYALAESIETREDIAFCYDPIIKLDSGDAAIIVKAVDEDSYKTTKVLFDMAYEGYRLLAGNYPKYVNIL